MKKVPITRFGLRNSDITLISKKNKTTVFLQSTDILGLNQKDRVALQIDLKDCFVKHSTRKEIPLRLQGELILTPQSLDLSALKLNMFNTVASLSGSFKNPATIHMNPEGTLNFEIFAELPQLYESSKGFIELAPLQGIIKTAGRIETGKSGLVSAGIKFSGQKIRYDKLDIGNVLFDGDFKNDVLNIPQIQITNEAGLIDILNLQAQLKKEEEKSSIDLSARLKSQQFDVREFLIRMGLKDLPIEVFASADLNCKGPAYPQADVICEGNVSGEQMEVRTGPRVQDTLVTVDEMRATGSARFTNKQISYKADLEMGKNKGSSEGVIGFKEGYKIKFQSPEFNFDNLGRTAGLKVEGIASLSGQTEGNSDYGTLEIDMTAKDAYFEDFKLGQVGGKIRYKAGILYFDNLQGSLGDRSRYEGNLQVNLDTKRIAAQANIPEYEIPALLSIFERRFQMPVEITGFGSAQVNVEGPFSLGLLSYQIKSKISQGMAAGESFDHIELDVTSSSGNMQVQKAVLRKGRTDIVLTGTSNPEGLIDLKVDTADLPLENSENISRIGSQISGLVDAEMSLKGFVLTPDVLLSGTVKNLVIEERDFPNSTFKTDFSRASVKGDINLFSGQLVAQFNYPMKETSPFMFKAQARDWNYAALFALIGGGSLLNDYDASLTGEMNMQSPEGGLWASTGKGVFKEISLERGSLSLKNKLPIEIEMNDGIGRFKNFRIESSNGDKAFFDIKTDGFSRNDLTMKISGSTNLRLFHIFVPFLEDLGGTVKLDINTAGPTSKPEILGTAQIDDGFVKMKVFPHPFERIKSEIQFSQSRVLINEFQGNLAGGRINGDGAILIEGPKKLPVNVKAKFENVNLNFPDGMRTSGDGDLSFTGNWFPYIFSGTYHVQGGFVDKEFQDDSAGANMLKQSAYLPKAVLQDSNVPILLDLNIILERPLPVKNSMIDATVTGNVIVRGPPNQFTLGGSIATEKGSKAIFRDKIFEIQTGNVQFNNSSDMNPEIYMAANSRINQYDIAMLIQGTAKSPLVRLSSTPPLNDQDIISLIALGVTSNRLEKQIDNTRKSDKATNDAIGGIAAYGVLSQIQPVKKLQQSTGVEIQFSSTNDDTKNISLQRVTLSKKITDKVRAAATQVSGNYSAQEYTLQYNFTESVSAIGRYEDRKPNETTGNIENSVKENQSILGLDLEFRREFK